MSQTGAQFGIGVAVVGVYALMLRAVYRRQSKRILAIFDQREEFLDLMWERQLPREHLRAAGVVPGLAMPATMGAPVAAPIYTAPVPVHQRGV